jgi:hypothetical protein
MTSEKKAEANRRNALKSTGPKTPEGKAAVSLSAVKHGLISQEVLLSGDDESVLKELGERLRAELQPVGALEDLLVDHLLPVFGDSAGSDVWKLAFSPGNYTGNCSSGRRARPNPTRGTALMT